MSNSIVTPQHKCKFDKELYCMYLVGFKESRTTLPEVRYGWQGREWMWQTRSVQTKASEWLIMHCVTCEYRIMFFSQCVSTQWPSLYCKHSILLIMVLMVKSELSVSCISIFLSNPPLVQRLHHTCHAAGCFYSQICCEGVQHTAGREQAAIRALATVTQQSSSSCQL